MLNLKKIIALIFVLIKIVTGFNQLHAVISSGKRNIYICLLSPVPSRDNHLVFIEEGRESEYIFFLV